MTGPVERPARQVARRFAGDRAALAGMAVFAAVVGCAFVGGLVWRYGPAEITPAGSAPPSWRHPFGTDAQGRDELALVLCGARRSIEVAFAAAALAGGAGTVWGAAAGYARGRRDGVLMRLAELVLALPPPVIAAVLAARPGGSRWSVAVVVGTLYAGWVARVVRAAVLGVGGADFVTAARGLGASGARILWVDIAPGLAATLAAAAPVLVAGAVSTEAAVSFLGFGVHDPDVSLGLLVAQSRGAVTTRWWLFVFPGVFLVALALPVTLVGEALREALAPPRRAGAVTPGRPRPRPGTPVPISRSRVRSAGGRRKGWARRPGAGP